MFTLSTVLLVSCRFESEQTAEPLFVRVSADAHGDVKEIEFGQKSFDEYRAFESAFLETTSARLAGQSTDVLSITLVCDAELDANHLGRILDLVTNVPVQPLITLSTDKDVRTPLLFRPMEQPFAENDLDLPPIDVRVVEMPNGELASVTYGANRSCSSAEELNSDFTTIVGQAKFPDVTPTAVVRVSCSGELRCDALLDCIRAVTVVGETSPWELFRQVLLQIEDRQIFIRTELMSANTARPESTGQFRSDKRVGILPGRSAGNTDPTWPI